MGQTDRDQEEQFVCVCMCVCVCVEGKEVGVETSICVRATANIKK